MQMATPETVLGDFNNTSITHFGITSSFFKKGGTFMVLTKGPDGKSHEYPVKYTFGVRPLQQYLIEFPGGRLQALNLAWDTRPKKQGGQHWFHLYPDEKVKADDELYWTKVSHNWNSMCAECHSTDLQKNYDPDSRTFNTTWSEIDVSCEACHGPGSDHIAWAGQPPEARKKDPEKGLVLQFDERRDVHWTIDSKSGNAKRSRLLSSEREIEMCARCHSRRSPISRNYVHGEPLLDHYLTQTLNPGMYYADGQIDDEVYVYGSFLQSKMYNAGVICSDCHEPHSLKLRVPGNGVCLQCHQAVKYDSQSHHFHKPGSKGASCAECHMPPKTYMVVDPRHDHSMRIPRPDLSMKLGTPNACTNCHTDKSAEWAAKQVHDWYGEGMQGFQRYAETFAAAHEGKPAVGDALADLVKDASTPDIARATALKELGHYLGAKTIDAIQRGLASDDPLVRVSAVQALQSAPMNVQVPLAFPALSDPILAVRIEAAQLLSAIPPSNFPDEQRSQLEQGQKGYIAVQKVMAERPEAQVNLGCLYAELDEADPAKNAFRTAIELDPAFVPAYVNFADMLRSQGEEAEAEKLLREGLKKVPTSADLYHALGLSLARQKRNPEALKALEQAFKLSPDNARYTYVLAVGLNSSGKTKRAIKVLQEAHNRFPNNTDILSALVVFHRNNGDTKAARAYAERLRDLSR